MWAWRVKPTEHKPVLLDAAIAGLGLDLGVSEGLRLDGLYVDGTYGRGGHSAAIISHLSGNGRLLAFDKDPDACAHAWKAWGGEPRFRIARASFSELNATLAADGALGKVDGLLLDLGVSSPQLETAERGFSFSRPGPLDMRMDPQSGISVSDWLATADVADITSVLKEYGEEPFAKRIAIAIASAAAEAPITTTDRLAKIISDCIPRRIAAASRTHPATRSFQALRIYINDELGDLRQVLEQSLAALAPGGRLVVISFHSLEDRIVKRFMREQARPEPPVLPMAPVPKPLLKLIGKPQYANAQELNANPRARSAVMRVAARTAAELPA